MRERERERACERENNDNDKRYKRNTIGKEVNEREKERVNKK